MSHFNRVWSARMLWVLGLGVASSVGAQPQPPQPDVHTEWARSERTALGRGRSAAPVGVPAAPLPVAPAVPAGVPMAVKPVPAPVPPVVEVTPVVPSPAAGQEAMSAPQVAGNRSGVWVVSVQDKTLYRTLLRWASQAQYQLLWQTDRDFPIETEVVFDGDFRRAVSEVMVSLSQTDHPLQAVFNPTTRVLRVVRWLDDKDPRR